MLCFFTRNRRKGDKDKEEGPQATHDYDSHNDERSQAEGREVAEPEVEMGEMETA